jgi:hypothetical protein
MRFVIHQTPRPPAEWAGIEAIPLGEGAVRHQVLLERADAPSVRFELRKSLRPECLPRKESG